MLFRSISRFYPIYQREETDQQYTHCLHSKGQGITIRSFFHLANQAGIPLAPFSKEHLSILPNIQNGKTGKWIKSEEELPVFPECVFEHLPPFLNEVVNNSISGNTGSSSSDFIHLPVFPFWIFGKMD